MSFPFCFLRKRIFLTRSMLSDSMFLRFLHNALIPFTFFRRFPFTRKHTASLAAANESSIHLLLSDLFFSYFFYFSCFLRCINLALTKNRKKHEKFSNFSCLIAAEKAICAGVRAFLEEIALFSLEKAVLQENNVILIPGNGVLAVACTATHIHFAVVIHHFLMFCRHRFHTFSFLHFSQYFRFISTFYTYLLTLLGYLFSQTRTIWPRHFLVTPKSVTKKSPKMLQSTTFWHSLSIFGNLCQFLETFSHPCSEVYLLSMTSKRFKMLIEPNRCRLAHHSAAARKLPC